MSREVMQFNVFVSNASFLYPLKTSESERVVKKGWWRNGALGTNGLKVH